VKPGPVRSPPAPAYATREQALADMGVQAIARPRQLFGHPLGLALGAIVAAGLACAYGCKATCPTVHLSESEALDILEDEFAAWGLELSREVGEGHPDLPEPPALVQQELSIAVSLVYDEDCEAYRSAAAALLASADERCGLDQPEDTAVPLDTGSCPDTAAPDDTAADTACPGDTGPPEETGRYGGSDRREDRALCRDFIEDTTCRTSSLHVAYGACLDFACSDLHWLGLAVDSWDFEVCESGGDHWMAWEVERFVGELQDEGVIPASGG
jgi:hypothetical protein